MARPKKSDKKEVPAFTFELDRLVTYKEFQELYFRSVLNHFGGNRSYTAKALGWSLRSVRDWAKRLCL